MTDIHGRKRWHRHEWRAGGQLAASTVLPVPLLAGENTEPNPSRFESAPCQRHPEGRSTHMRRLGPIATNSLGQGAQAEAGAGGTPTLHWRRRRRRHGRFCTLSGRVVRQAVRPLALAHPVAQQDRRSQSRPQDHGDRGLRARLLLRTRRL